MKVLIKHINNDEEQRVEIFCYEHDERIRRLKHYVENLDARIEGKNESETVFIGVSDILYIETVDNKVFIYTKDMVLETGKKLYELEAVLDSRDFFRCNKSMIVNINRIISLKPELTRNISATMDNGEVIEISRRYVKAFKELLLIGEKNDKH